MSSPRSLLYLTQSGHRNKHPSPDQKNTPSPQSRNRIKDVRASLPDSSNQHLDLITDRTTLATGLRARRVEDSRWPVHPSPKTAIACSVGARRLTFPPAANHAVPTMHSSSRRRALVQPHSRVHVSPAACHQARMFPRDHTEVYPHLPLVTRFPISFDESLSILFPTSPPGSMKSSLCNIPLARNRKHFSPLFSRQVSVQLDAEQVRLPELLDELGLQVLHLSELAIISSL